MLSATMKTCLKQKFTFMEKVNLQNYTFLRSRIELCLLVHSCKDNYGNMKQKVGAFQTGRKNVICSVFSFLKLCVLCVRFFCLWVAFIS